MLVCPMTCFQDSLYAAFPGAVSENSFVSWSKSLLEPHGFVPSNTLTCVGVCRDELCRSLVWNVRESWGEAFNFSGLGGMLTLGKAGFQAAHYHAPIDGGRERYLYIIMPHIGISEEGEYGKCIRSGRHGSSAACGALTSVLEEVRHQKVTLELDHQDLEYSLLKQHLIPRLDKSKALDIVSITHTMADLITEELEEMIKLTVDTQIAEYALITGVQIHCPVSGSMIWIHTSYVCIQGQKIELQK